MVWRWYGGRFDYVIAAHKFANTPALKLGWSRGYDRNEAKYPQLQLLYGKCGIYNPLLIIC